MMFFKEYNSNAWSYTFEFWIQGGKVWVKYNNNNDCLLTDLIKSKHYPEVKQLLQDIAIHIKNNSELYPDIEISSNWMKLIIDFIQRYFKKNNNILDVVIKSNGSIILNLEEKRKLKIFKTNESDYNVFSNQILKNYLIEDLENYLLTKKEIQKLTEEEELVKTVEIPKLQECVIVGGKFNKENIILAKNRDRTYIPEVSIVQEILDFVEVTYLIDETTGWIEGMNEYGIGVVNSALLVHHDEKEGKYSRSTGKKSEDAPRVLKALSYTSIEDAVHSVAFWDGGIRGHTFVANKFKIYHVENTGRHDPIITEIKDKAVFTNHGFNYQDIGYQVGEKFLSSKIRKSSIENSLSGEEIAETILDELADRKNENDFLNALRDSNGMMTTCQIALDLFDLKFYFRPVKNKIDFKGINSKVKNPKVKIISLDEISSSEKFEELTIRDWTRSSATMPIIKRTSKIRKQVAGDEKVLSKFLGISGKPNSPVINFKTKSTFSNEIYKTKVKLIDLNKWRKNKYLYNLTLSEFKEILEVCDIKMSCECMAWHWMGLAYMATELDSSIDSVTIPNPIWKTRKGYQEPSVCKHLKGVLKLIKPNAGRILQTIKDRYSAQKRI